MIQRKWLWASVLALPLAIGGGLVFAATQVQSFTCPFTGKVISWSHCCPLSGSSEVSTEPSATCPVSDEESLPCESCCPETSQQ
jgi:hypothetical protein